MFDLREYKNNPDRLSDLLPWAALIAPGIVLNKDGSFQRTVQFRGPDLESSSDEQMVGLCARLNNLLKRLGSGWALTIEAKRANTMTYPKAHHFPDPISRLIDLERHELFIRKETHYQSDYYLTLQFLPANEVNSKAQRLFLSRENDQPTEDHWKQLGFFKESTQRVFDLMQDLLYETKFLNDEETLTYLHACISNKSHRIQAPKTPMYLDGILADTPLIGGLAPQLGDHHLRTVSILGFPGQSVPAMLNQLNDLSIEYRWVTRFIPLDKLDANKLLKQYKKRWFSKRKGIATLLSEIITKGESVMTDNSSVNKSADADSALQELEDDLVAYGYYTMTITVTDKDESSVNEKVREVERTVNGIGFTTINETLNAVEAWLSSIPGNTYANVRMPLIHTLNLSHLIPLSSVWRGPQKNAHLNACPLFYCATRGNTPFLFVNHVGDVGHQMIIGPTGSGKSVFMNFMALQFLRYKDAQVFIFDKGGSFLSSTLGVNGQYFEVGKVDNTHLTFQPLRDIDHPEERQWANDWLLGLLANEKVTITPDVKQHVWQALCDLATLDHAHRTLSGFQSFVQSKQLRSAIGRYTTEGPFGTLLDNNNVNVSLSNWQCFEMERLMDMPDIIAPILSYLFHIIEARFTGKPSLLILDEAWLFFDHPIFSNKIHQWLKTLRKHNVSVIFATQSIDDILDSEIATTLIESCPSHVFLPNSRAQEPNVYETYKRIGLNDQQINLLAAATPKRHYYFSSSQGNSLFDLELGPIALAFCAASKPEEKERINTLYSSSDNYQDYLKKYLNANGLNNIYDLVAQENEAHTPSSRPTLLQKGSGGIQDA